MTVTELNPAWLVADTYIEFLNRGFPGQWDHAAHEFYVGRGFGGKATDVAVRSDGGTVLAGVSFCYRQLCIGSEAPLDVCIMSAGTTLPSERGRGHYAELLRIGLELCRAKSCAAILGFVTRENASGRGLMRLGAYSIPSFYIVSTGRHRPSHLRARMLARTLDPNALSPHRFQEYASSQVRIDYPCRQDWLQQFVRRPNPVRALRLGHDAVALLESVGSADRLQWLGCPAGKCIASISALAASSSASGRQFFMYTLDPVLAAGAKRLGLRLRAGRLMLLPLDDGRTDWARIAAAPWRLQSGDRM